MLPPPFRREPRGRIDSSNDEARRLAQQGAQHGTVVTAREQTSGRGRRGRVWHSPPGNLHCSILLDSGPDLSLSPQLAFVAAVALQAALTELTDVALFHLKWPNDLLCQGAKLAGMLLEQEGALIILGVGVNVVAHPDPALYPATSLRRIGSNASDEDVLDAFCRQLARRYQEWRQDGFAPIRAAWLSVACGAGEPITARLADRRELQGRFIGLGADGALELADALGERHRVLAGDVFFDRAGAHHAAGH
jgi:BirA family biotin operon repressor/biotin-[acetyl-CoA-carboxylase] ligase